MMLPFDFSNISLWITTTTIVLLITLEVTSTYYGQTNLRIDRQKLRDVTWVFSVLFVVVVAIAAINIITQQQKIF